MLQNYKNFSGQIKIIITSVIPKNHYKKDDLFVVNKLSEIKESIQLIRKGGRFKEIYIIYPDPKKALNYLAECFKQMVAAGGVVKNTKGDLLFIYKNKKWDLPKGRVKKGEKKRDAAIRETSKECGVRQLEITREIDKTYHIGSKNRKRFY